MQRTTTQPSSRRSFLSRILLATIAAPAIGMWSAGGANATKTGKNTIASVGKRLENAKDTCELIGNGKLDTVSLPSGTKITYCTGGTHDGTRCKHTSQESSCTCSNTGKPGDCTQTLTAGSGDSAEDGIVVPDTIAARASNGSPRRRRRRR